MRPTGPRDVLSAVVRMAHLALRRRELAWVRRDPATGGWRHAYVRGGTLVTPRPRGITWKMTEERLADVFCHLYTPRPGDTVIELGAEFGAETVVLSRLVGPHGKVIAVEAQPWTCALLEETVRSNGLDNVQVVNAAVTGTIGAVGVTETHSASDHVFTGSAGVQVPSTTVDALVRDHSLTRVDMVKMNIEGSESDAMRGMAESAKMIRHAVISCHDFRADRGDGEHFRTSDQVEAALAAWNYSVQRRNHDHRSWIREYRYARNEDLAPVS